MLCHSVADVGPEYGSRHVEPRVDRPKQFIVRVLAEAAIAHNIRESFLESHNTVLHESEGAEPENSHSGNSVSFPVSINVLLECLMEYTISTKINN